MDDKKIIREINTTWVRVYLADNGIIYTEQGANCPQESSKEIGEKVTETIDKVCDGKVYPMVSFIGDRRIAKEERYYYQNNNSLFISHVAMVVTNPFQKLLASFFMGLNKVPLPSKVFSNEQQATEWIQEFRKKNQST